MKSIKFRVWTGEKMEYDILAGKLGNFYAYIDPKDSASVINTKYAETYPVMQNTGLKDKNGKEIYEGDIVGFTKNCQPRYYRYKEENGKENLREVVYIGYDASFGLKNEASFPILAYNGMTAFEIKGNIYENPELIKV